MIKGPLLYVSDETWFVWKLNTGRDTASPYGKTISAERKSNPLEKSMVLGS